MQKIWTEDDVNMPTLQQHFADSGLDVLNAIDTRFGVYSGDGLYIAIRLDPQKKYLRFSCSLALDANRSHVDQLQRMQRYNHDIFLARFSLINDRHQLLVSYVMSYQSGLIPGQMMHVFRRFSDVLDLVVDTKNEDHMIVFSQVADDNTASTTKSGTESVSEPMSESITESITDSESIPLTLNEGLTQ